jgi:hypothetical protein
MLDTCQPAQFEVRVTPVAPFYTSAVVISLRAECKV